MVVHSSAAPRPAYRSDFPVHVSRSDEVWWLPTVSLDGGKRGEKAMNKETQQARARIITRYQIVATGSLAVTAEVAWGGHNHLHTSLRIS